MKKQKISLLNTIIKTILSVILVVSMWWFILHKVIGYVILTSLLQEIIHNILSVLFNFFCVYVLWKILPYDTKVWIKNWKQPDFIKTGSWLSLLSTIIKIPLGIIGSWFLIENLTYLPILAILDSPIIKCILIIIVFCYLLPGDIKHWIKQWNK